MWSTCSEKQQDILGALLHKQSISNDTNLTDRLKNTTKTAQSISSLRTVVGGVYGGNVTVNISYRSYTIQLEVLDFCNNTVYTYTCFL